MKDLLLVDGYNVINRGRRYATVKDTDLEAARARLVEDVAAYAQLAGIEATVVFDGKHRPGTQDRESTLLGIRVVFTKEAQSADSAIERMSHAARRERRVIVATSDYAQQKTVFAKGVLRVSAAELLARMQDEQSEAKDHTRTGRKRVFLQDRIDEQVREALRKMVEG